ncbi:hypothetical protein [Cupriavidus sp. D39]|uniref:hypothetical protein n=1 Tax=Cupriavidus sp. D39 TaxID=2997877 RepID=UPI002271941A|nr:hypothetical protein [Cupriavidus sp. D39]MCY0856021.1 hypothetical protein [Cupriavidus sp. D39]
MPTCFVIQPFDSGKFDKRYESVFEPAIRAAGMEPYRVDKDSSATVLIQAIEENIKRAAVCLADITTDNPNVWYELGFAQASGRPLVMVCGDERQREGKKFPFDVQHRAIVTYKTEAIQDFEDLRERLTTKLVAMLQQGDTIEQLAERETVAPVDGLSPAELTLLAVAAESVTLLDQGVGVWGLKQDMERAGLNGIGFALGLRRLTQKGLIETVTLVDERHGEPYDGIRVTPEGWDWVDANESKFVVHNKKAALSSPWEQELEDPPY